MRRFAFLVERWASRLGSLPDQVAGPAVLLVFALVVFVRIWTRPALTLLGADFVQFYLWEGFVRSQFAGGTLPLWNPYVFSGYPALANPEFLVFYPPSMLLRLLPIPIAFTLGIMLHLWWGASGVYLLLRVEGSSRAGSLLGALAFGFGGFLLPRVAAGHVTVIYTTAWLPWVLLTLRYALEAPAPSSRRLTLVWPGICAALQVLAGSPNVSLLTALLAGGVLLEAGVDALWHREQAQTHRVVLVTVVTAAVAAGLAAIQLAPSLELTALSTRSDGQPVACMLPYSLDAADFTTFALPAPLANSPLPWEKSAYPGAVIAGLALIGLASPASDAQRRWKRLLVTILCVSLLLAPGPHLPLYSALYNLLPGMRLFRVPSRFVMLALLAIGGLAALGLDAFAHSERRARWAALTVAIAAGASGIAVAALIDPPNFAHHIRFVLERFQAGITLANAIPAILTFRDAVFAGLMLASPRLLALAVILGAAFHATHRGGWPRALTLALITLAGIDLWAYGQPHLRMIDPANVTGMPVRTPLPEQARVLITPYMYANSPTNRTFASAQGYAAIVLRSYEDYVSGGLIGVGCSAYEHASIDPADEALLASLSVSTVISFDSTVNLPNERLPGYSYPVYDLPAYAPRVIWTDDIQVAPDSREAVRLVRASGFDTASSVVLEGWSESVSSTPSGEGSARITRYDANRVEIAVSASKPGVIVLNDVWYPGWHAEVNGATAALFRANGAFRAVAVPPGESAIVMRYRSRFLPSGALVSGITLVTLVIVAVCEKHRERATGSPPA